MGLWLMLQGVVSIERAMGSVTILGVPGDGLKAHLGINS